MGTGTACHCQGQSRRGSTARPPRDAPARISSCMHSWIVTVDHKKIGMMYIGYALVFLLMAGVEAMLIRIQLVVPHNHFRFAVILTTACSPCTAPRWCSWWGCRSCSGLATILCR